MGSRPDQLSPNFVFWVRLAPAEQFENRDSLPCRSCNRSAGLWRAKFFLRSARSEENRNDQDRDDIDDFDHRIDGRSRGIFVGIANGITGDRCRVRERPFAAEISFFDEFLGIIPRTAARCHGDGDEQSSDDRSDEQTAQNHRSKWLMVATATTKIRGKSAGTIISRKAALVTMSTQVPYSGVSWPVRIPGFAFNCRRTSRTTAPAALPTASMLNAVKINGSKPPRKRPMITFGSFRENWNTNGSPLLITWAFNSST